MRWSLTSDLVDAIEHVARLSLLARAERENQADEVEEQLFRFSRILDAQPRLTTLLGDYSKPAAGPGRTGAQGARAGPAGPTPRPRLCWPRLSNCCAASAPTRPCWRLAQLAVARRGEIVAQVSAATDLSDAQRSRLTELLTRIYDHPVSVQLNIDPDVLGGLSVAVGDEVIDGTLSSRLAAAATKLPD